jgi:hypothetical protein
LNRTFRKSTPGGRGEYRQKIPAVSLKQVDAAAACFVDPGDGKADLGAHPYQPDGLFENVCQVLLVRLDVAQVPPRVGMRRDNRVEIIGNDPLQQGDQLQRFPLHGSCPLKHEPHKISAIWRAWIRIPKIAEAIERARRLARSHRG